MSDVKSVELVGISVEEAAALVAVMNFAKENGAGETPMAPHLSRVMQALKDAHGIDGMEDALSAMKESEQIADMSHEMDLVRSSLSDQDREALDNRVESNPKIQMIGIVQPKDNWVMVGMAVSYFIMTVHGKEEQIEKELKGTDKKQLAGFMMNFIQKISGAIDQAEKRRADSDKKDKAKKATKKKR